MRRNGTVRASSSVLAMKRMVLPILLVSVVGSFMCVATKADDPGIAFDQYEIEIGAAKRQTVLIGFLMGGDYAELVVINNDNRQMRIYSFNEGAWAPSFDVTLRGTVQFVDVGTIGGRDRLLMYEPGQLSVFDPSSAAFDELVAISSPYKPSREGEIPHVDITRDVNDDGLDDLVIPGADGFRVSRQAADGTFADPVQLASTVRLPWTDRTNPWLQSLVQTADYDRDGRTDLLLWNADHFDAYLQDDFGGYAMTGNVLKPPVRIDSLGLYSLSTPQREVACGADQCQTVLSSVEDLNADGVADLVILAQERGGPIDVRSLCEVRFGSPLPDGGAAYSRGSGITLQSDDLQLGRRQHDIDGDGQVDMMLIKGELSASSMVEGMATGALPLTLEFFLIEGGRYPDKPNATREIRGVFNEDEYFQSVLLADVNGDGRSDLLVQSGRNELRIFPGVSGPGLFSEVFQTVEAAMPDNEKDTRLVDLNKDGRRDVLMHRRYTHCFWRQTDPREPHVVTLLMPR